MEIRKHDFYRKEINSVGFADAKLLDCSQEGSAFGDRYTTYRIGNFLLRIVREKGQEFVDIAFASEPQTFFQCDDVDVAMRWKSVKDVVEKLEPESLIGVLSRLSEHFLEINLAFSEERMPFTKARIHRAARARGEAFISHIRN